MTCARSGSERPWCVGPREQCTRRPSVEPWKPTDSQYIILQRIERVKELLRYDELSLKEIAFSLGYSSIAHLSNQFKKVTGLTPTQFKKLAESTRVPLDAVGRT